MRTQKIKVLVVDDSNVVQMLLVHLLNSDPHIQVIGTASNGKEALEFLTQKTPDLILMDIDMPEMGGFEATRRIMETHPMPIVICTASMSPRDSVTTFRTMEAGAVACVEKPMGQEHKDFEAMAANLLQTVKLMSELKVVRRWPRQRENSHDQDSPVAAKEKKPGQVQVIGIGASTGGPPVLQTILTALPKDFPVPVLIVQHIAPGFLEGLVEWLNQTTGMKVHAAAYGMHPLPGHVYLAPDDYHMAVRGDGRIVLSKEEAEKGLRPSVNHLFRSIANVYGSASAAVLLTGMGRDGADELKRLKDRGALTIVQDRESSVVYGMPGEALALNAATYVLSPDKIAPALLKRVRQAGGGDAIAP